MKILNLIIIFALILAVTSPSYSDDVEGEKERKSSSGNEALTGALMGGLLGAGVGAAIGSASGKAGQGAAIGAGVGAVGGTLIGADQASRKAREGSYEEEPPPPKRGKIKKRIVREYDEEGNIISEKEIAN